MMTYSAMAAIPIVLAIIVLAAAAAFFWFFKTQIPTEPPARPAKDSYSVMADKGDSPPFNSAVPTYAAQSLAWQHAMTEIGARLRSAGVGAIHLAHGTFVGNDPLSVAVFIKGLLPRFGARAEAALGKFSSLQSDFVFGDNGNFLPQYVTLMNTALGGSPPCYLFSWGSGNHHIHRLQGAIRLALSLARNAPINKRYLLIGHSHAGQMFALLTQLLGRAPHAKDLIAIAAKSGEDISHLDEALRALQQCHIDFVTLGTPPRYTWWEDPKYRLLSIVNHRGETPEAGDWRGFLRTQHGDYVQRWGIGGSDFLAGTGLERELNIKLNAILGEGFNPRSWLDGARKQHRLQSSGHSYLVDYRDQGGSIPNFIGTIFGHGIYTKYDVMLFNLQLITKYFYS